MPIRHLMTFGATLLTMLTVIAAADAGDAARCSVVPFAGGREPGAALLLGTASPDTVAAGAGEVTTGGDGGHAGRVGSGPIFGQLIEVARHAGADSLVLARAFERSGSGRVVIVPWSYDAACQPIRWTRGAAWVSLAEPGVFAVRPRPDSLWAGGVPTFDAFMATFEPYRHGDFYRRGHMGTDSLRTTRSLTPAEYFELLRVIPDWETLNTAPEDSWDAILEWQAAHPELAARFPATRMIASIGQRLAYAKGKRAVRAIEPIVAGTWRFAFALDEGPERVFHARTRPRPTSDWRAFSTEQPALDPALTPTRPDGYHLMASGALSADLLPSDCERDRDIRREGYIAALDPAPFAGEERTEWIGFVDPRLFAKQFPGDSALGRFAREHMMQGVGRSRDVGRVAPARFTLGDDGVMRVQQTIALDDGSSIVLRGERVSMVVIECDW
jgi:hypothetical protein